MNETDILIVGGGVVGMAIGYGLLKRGKTVTILDEGDTAFRASLGNQGMVWCQLKGFDYAAYARITKSSVDRWLNFSTELREETGVDCAYSQKGGLTIASGDEEFHAFLEAIKLQKTHFKNDEFEHEIYGRQKLKSLFPDIGEEVSNAIYTPYDGICNPLALLKALHQAFIGRGGLYKPYREVHDISKQGDGTYIVCAGAESTKHSVAKVVLAAGLGNRSLAAKLNESVPVIPNRGQILVTERLSDFDFLPNNIFRPNKEGTLLIGASSADSGYDKTIDLNTSGNIAANAINIFPWLKNVRVVRMWSCLRVMTPDGKPIYQELASNPGVFIATCHSGITLTPFHVNELAKAIDERKFVEDLSSFRMERFNV